VDVGPLVVADAQASELVEPGERHASPVTDQMVLAPTQGRSVGFGPVWSPPYTARMEQLSTTAPDQSIRSERASQSSSAK
jgi:hypothetical protein